MLVINKETQKAIELALKYRLKSSENEITPGSGVYEKAKGVRHYQLRQCTPFNPGKDCGPAN